MRICCKSSRNIYVCVFDERKLIYTTYMSILLSIKFQTKFEIHEEDIDGITVKSNIEAREDFARLFPKFFSREAVYRVPPIKQVPPGLPLHFPEEKITITSATSLISVYRAPRRARYVMANTVIPHSSREHRER